MAWGTVVLGSEITSARLGVVVSEPRLVGYVGSNSVSPTIDQLLDAPFVKGLLEIASDNTLAAVGTTPDFPVLPKWRKVVRQIG